MIVAIHGTPTMLVLAVAGGGNAVIGDLLDVGGASRTVLEIVVPYAATAMDQFVGSHAPTPAPPAVSAAQAEAMASAALERARLLAPDTPDLLGVGVTAALVSDRPKRGEHRAHLAIARPGGIVVSSKVSLAKGELDRRGEDRAVADAVLAAIAAACGVASTNDQMR